MTNPIDDGDSKYVQRTTADKELIKEALKEWVDDQFTKFGKWSAMAIFGAAFAIIVYAAWQIGWRP